MMPWSLGKTSRNEAGDFFSEMGGGGGGDGKAGGQVVMVMGRTSLTVATMVTGKASYQCWATND